MDLNTIQDIQLIRNCTLVKIKCLNSQQKFPTENEIEPYYKLLTYLNNNDIENAESIINNPNNQKDFAEFCQEITQLPPNQIAKKYVDLAETFYKESNSFSDEKFEQFKQVFYKGNEHLSRTNNEFEEEPEKLTSSKHFTEDIKSVLDNLNAFIRKINPKTISPSQFKSFSEYFRDTTMFLAQKKFQQYFSEINKHISEMTISYKPDTQNTVYQTSFVLLNDKSQKEFLSLEEPIAKSALLANYYQNLCFSYLEADKYSKIDESYLNTDSICEQMKTFKDCYEKLHNMSQYKVNILANTMIRFSDESNVNPTELDYSLDEACSTEEIENGIEI